MTSRLRGRRAFAEPLLGVLAACLLALAGCGGDDEPARGPAPRPADQIAVAVAGSVGIDPLRADDRATQFVLRQAFEPLTGVAEPPFGRAGSRRGLVLAFRPNRDATVWTGRLRHGVRFVGGTPFNASAVALNARRWAKDAPELVPELRAADAPRTDRVRLILSDPVRDLPEQLSDPRLGIVSPQAIRQRGNDSFQFIASAAAGTGAFLVERRPQGGVTMTRNPNWWGTALGLGPVISRIGFSVERDSASRYALLDAGQVQIADELGKARRATVRDLRANPLLEDVRAPGSLMGVERSLRGLDPAVPGMPLSGAWLTTVNQEGPPA